MWYIYDKSLGVTLEMDQLDSLEENRKISGPIRLECDGVSI